MKLFYFAILASLLVSCDSSNERVPVDATDRDTGCDVLADSRESDAAVGDVVQDLTDDDPYLADDRVEKDVEGDGEPGDHKGDMEPDQIEDCGNGSCEVGEDPCSCPEDCMGNGDLGTGCCAKFDCAQPACGPCCDVECVNMECVLDVVPGPCCWNGECEEGENPETCPEDCPGATCGDGSCNGIENPCTCSEDCKLDGVACCTDQDCPPLNCGPCCVIQCVDYVCGQEAVWLDQCCFNNKCEAGESSANCPTDCACGNGTCDAGEDPVTCDADCDGPANTANECLSAPSGQCGQATGRTKVVVDDWQGTGVATPYEGVLVEAILDGEVVAADLSSELGDYEIILAPGNYVLRATPPAIENMWDEVFPLFIDENITITADTDTITDYQFTYSGMVVDKPNIYLYPESTTQVSVKLDFAPGSFLTVSDPDYGQGWDVTVEPAGLIDGQYGFLFYEAAVNAPFQMEEGFNVAREDLETWMYTALSAYGLNQQESFDFVDFWMSALPLSAWYVFYPQYAQQIDPVVGLDIQPKPDSLLRLWFVVDPVSQPVSVLAPVVPAFQRYGFTVVEWGVIVVD